MKRMKWRALLILIMTGIGMISAEASSLIEIQQQRLKAISPLWTQRHVPAGMPGIISNETVRSSGTSGVSLYAQHVNFTFTDDIGFHIDQLTASFEPRNPKDPVNLDDPQQFIIRVHTGTVIVPPRALTALFNKQLLDYWPRPLNHLTVKTGNNVLTAQGGLRLWSWFPPIGWIPACLKGNVQLNQQNKIVYTPTDIRALGIPIAGLLHALNIKLTSLITLHRQGVDLVGSALVLDHTKLFPPPELAGTITYVHLSDAGLQITFNDNVIPIFSPPTSAPDSFLWIQSGDIKLFDTVVNNANVLIQNDNKNVDLHFDLYDYRQMFAIKNNLNMAEDGSIVVTLSTH